MQIKNEAHLVSELAIGLKQIFCTDIAVKEFSAGYGIADLVFAKDYSSNTNTLDREPVNNYYAVQVLLSKFEDGLFSRDDIKKIAGIGDDSARRVMNLLIQDGYAVRHDARLCQLTRPIDNPIKKIVAIEAKLRDWKSGILQARRYKSFTDECYLAILADYEKNIDTSLLDTFGVGLIIFDQSTGELTLKKKPIEGTYLPFYKDEMGLFAKEHFLYRANSLELA